MQKTIKLALLGVLVALLVADSYVPNNMHKMKNRKLLELISFVLHICSAVSLHQIIRKLDSESSNWIDYYKVLLII